MISDDELSGPWVDRFLFAPGLRIGGGTDEIQRNTIAERGLGLPRRGFQSDASRAGGPNQKVSARGRRGSVTCPAQAT